MAIIRIRRTTNTVQPTGLTFGEFAFIGRTGGVTANQLYIGDAQGNSVWIASRIEPNPLTVTGVTAETTTTTIKGVRDLAAAFAGTTAFSSNISVVLSSGRSFGKYVNGNTINASGKTAVEVIIDSLTEYLGLTAGLVMQAGNQPSGSHPTSAGGAGYGATAQWIPYGATGNRTTNTITLGVTYNYTINSPGFTALGATLEWQKNATSNPASLSSGWNPISGTFFDDNGGDGFWTQINGTTFGSGLTAIAITQWDTTNIHFRYTVRDVVDLSANPTGITYAYRTVSPQTFSNPTVTISSTGVTASTTYTIPSGWSAGTGTLRERGNTATTVNSTITVGSGMYSEYHWLSRVGIQYSTDNGTNWYWTNNTTNTPVMLSTPIVGSTGTTFSITSPAGSGITSMRFRFHMNEGLTYTSSGSPATGYSTDPTSNSSTYVSFRKRIFYGPTASIPSTAAAVRSLPFSLLGPTSGSPITAGSAAGAFTFSTGNQYTNFIVALPKGLTLNDYANAGAAGTQYPGIMIGTDVIFGKQIPSNDAAQAISLNQATDITGVAHDYVIYAWSTGATYDNLTAFVNFNGTINPH